VFKLSKKSCGFSDEPERPRLRVSFVGSGAASLPPPAKGLGSALSSRSGVRVEALKGLLCVLQTPSGISWYFISLNSFVLISFKYLYIFKKNNYLSHCYIIARDR